MAPHTSLADYTQFAGDQYESSQDSRVLYYLPIAERSLLRRVGTDFYEAGTPAGEDWIFTVCVLTDWFLIYDDPDTRADLGGPYQSERLGDWAFTLRKDMWTPYRDLRIRDIIETYTTNSTLSGIMFITAVGPAPYGGVETTER
jgi:hypothetical protein